MSQLDYAKDDINTSRLYMGFVVASLLAVGGGVGSLYSSDKINAAFWVGIAIIISLLVVFVLLARSLHNKTNKLKEL
jgi:ABC-type Mn2+/Zn2+ transport system permease subunit